MRGRLAILMLWLVGGAGHAASAAAPRDDKPDYSQRRYIFNGSGLRPVPHASFISADALRTYRKCLEGARTQPGSNKDTCSSYEYQVPYSLDTETVRVGQDLRQNWQRLEDRYYWRTLLELNNPAMYFTHCLVDWGRNQEANKPELVNNIEPGMYPKQLNGKLPNRPVKDNLFMDSYSILPNVPNKDYCDDYNLDFSLMYLPGSCIWASGVKVFCIEGDQETLSPMAPRPLYFNYQEALRRIQKATQRAETTYQKDYQADVLKSVKPTAKFFPLLWDNMLTGALVAPAHGLRPDLQGVLEDARAAGEKLGGIFRATAPAYYAQGLTGNAMTLPLRAHLLPDSQDALQNPPGVWQLEEFKRTFPVNVEPLYERFGYTNIFSAWTRAKTALLPEKAEAKPLRQMIYMASGINFYVPSPVPIPVPAPILMREYVAGLPYAGVQTHFTWNSVAEGYPVPRVNGMPPVDYRGVLK